MFDAYCEIDWERAKWQIWETETLDIKKIHEAHKTCYVCVLLWHPWHRSQASTIRESRIVHLIFLVSCLPWCRWFLRRCIARNNSIADANAISISTHDNRWPFIVLQRPIDRKIHIYHDRLLYYKNFTQYNVFCNICNI